MLTKNGKKIIVFGIMNSSQTGSSSQPSNATSFQITNTSGTVRQTGTTTSNVTSAINALNYMSTSGLNSTTYIKCGTGTTTATEDDYNLEVEATGLTCDSVVTAVGGNNTKTYTATFSNTTSSDIAITEIGFFMDYNYQGYVNEDFLLDHIILDTPITIPAGESKAITYEISF